MSLVDAFADFVGSVPSRRVALPWGECRVWDTGAGRPVVLLHGIAASRRVFFRLVPLLAARRRVVVPLLRG
ncbi:MAG: alpha/beta fold hydrolase, partial [Planctomycetota bacterium]